MFLKVHHRSKIKSGPEILQNNLIMIFQKVIYKGKIKTVVKSLKTKSKLHQLYGTNKKMKIYLSKFLKANKQIVKNKKIKLIHKYKNYRMNYNLKN
jgi:hypothetical protein